MADINLSSIVGSGGSSWLSDGITTLELASGQTGELLNITAPAGKLFKVFHFITTASGQSGISLTRDSIPLEVEQMLAPSSGSTSSSVFAILRKGDVAASVTSNAYYEVEGKNILIEKNAGNTTVSLQVSYETGRYA